MLRKGTKYYGIMPLMPCDLRALRGLSDLKGSERRLVGRYVMREIAADLAKCHSAGYVHNDLKLQNVLVSKDQIALADFGVCQSIQLTRTGKGKICGTPEFWPWEMYSAKNLTFGYDEKFDIFALALIWGELIVPLSKNHYRGSMLWPSKKAVFKESKSYPIHPGWKSTSMWKRLELTANLLSSFYKFYEDIGDAEEGAKKKIWKKIKERKTFLAGFSLLYYVDGKLFDNLVEYMLDPNPEGRPSANDVYSEANSLLGSKADDAKNILDRLIQKLDKTKQRGYEKLALKEGRDYFRKSQQKMKTQSSQKNLLRCRYCKATFSYTPLWCKCGRPSYTADGPTFQRVS